MFGKYKLEAKLVKETAKEEDTPVVPLVNADDIQRVAKNVVKYVAIGTAAVLATAAILDTASKIIVDKATENNED